MNGVTTARPVSDKALPPTRTHTEKEMETLSEALGRSAKQSQPLENLHRMAMEKNIGEELGPSSAALRPL